MNVGKWNKEKQSELRKTYENNASIDRIKSAN